MSESRQSPPATAVVRSARWRAGLVGVLLGAGAVVPVAMTLAPQAQAQAGAVAQPLVTGLPDFTQLVEKTSPSVVNIRTTEHMRMPPSGRRGGALPPGMDPGFEEFLRRFGIPLPGGRGMPPGGQPDDEEGDGFGSGPARRGVGSGFILSPDGYVMTNAHVVEGADELLVTLTDKREFKAKVIGADRNTDVAVVKIDATGLPAVKIGDVNQLKVGQWVVAIGSPFNLDNTVTAGIVSAKQRETNSLLPFIQTDVAVNPGNSGGPLLNMRGEVVGINSQIYSPSGAFAGISFAIPIDEAMRVGDQLRASGRVTRGRIGIQMGQPITKEVADSLGLPKAGGVPVQAVEKGSPAEKAGLEQGDIITKVDGKDIERPTDLQRAVFGAKIGTTVAVQVFRRGETKNLNIAVADLDKDGKTAQGPAEKSSPSAQSSLGLTVADLSDAQRRELRLSGGVRVEKVDGAAERAGLRAGDVILQIDNAQTADVRQFNAAVARIPKGKAVTVLVRRGDWVNYIVLKPAAN